MATYKFILKSGTNPLGNWAKVVMQELVGEDYVVRCSQGIPYEEKDNVVLLEETKNGMIAKYENRVIISEDEAIEI